MPFDDSESDFRWRPLYWNEFESLWTTVLSNRPYGKQDGVLNLFTDTAEVRELLGDKLLPFCQALYCYDLIQQVYCQYYQGHYSDVRHTQIGAEGVLSLSRRISPASMPLALLSHKPDDFGKLTHDEYRIWQKVKQAFQQQLRRCRYEDLSNEAPNCFPKVDEYRGHNIVRHALKKHSEIDSLISTLRFKHLHYDCPNCRRMDCYCSESTSKLRVSFREVTNAEYELEMFQKIWFSPVENADTISVSANLAGFTMINAVSRALGYDWDWVRQVAEVANKRREVICLRDLKPRLIIVPKTFSKDASLTRQLLTQVLHEANELGAKVLHMTHYGFCNGLSSYADLTVIFRDLMYPHLQTSIERVVFDYDTRARYDVFKSLELSVREYKPRFM